MFKIIETIDDVLPGIAGKKEIVVSRQPGGVQMVFYQFMDSKTFDTPEAIEARGIAFDQSGKIISRPLHKFFNLGEKEHLSLDNLRNQNNQIVRYFDKIDGSMIASAHLNGQLRWRSKKTFTSDVAQLAAKISPEGSNVYDFADELARRGYTAVFELTHPDARIVVKYNEPQMRLLHVRHNITGEYVMLDPNHDVHNMIEDFGIALVKPFDFQSIDEAVSSLTDMQNQEGYVAQFLNGDMVKFKCPWYLRLHRSITFLRERDIAVAALHENLDDVKNALREAGVDLSSVEEVETRLKNRLIGIRDEVSGVYESDRHLDRKSFAQKHMNHPYFGLLMSQYSGKEPDISGWFEKNHLRDEFSLRVLADGARAEEFEMRTGDQNDQPKTKMTP